MVSLAAVILTIFVLLLKAHSAKANDWANDMTVCRLVKCMKIDKRTEACVFRGAHNTGNPVFRLRRMEAAGILVSMEP